MAPGRGGSRLQDNEQRSPPPGRTSAMSITHRTDGSARRPVMTSRRWLGLAVSSAAAVAVLTAGTSAKAAPGGAHGTNNRTAPIAAPHDPQAPNAAPAVTTLHYYSLAASAFAPDGLHTTTSDYFNQWDPSTLSNQDSGRCFNAGLSLPDGAHLKNLTIYYTASSNPMFFTLDQQTLTAQTTTELVTFETATATTPTYSSVSKAFPTGTTVSMATHAYSAGVCPGAGTTFSG